MVIVLSLLYNDFLQRRVNLSSTLSFKLETSFVTSLFVDKLKCLKFLPLCHKSNPIQIAP